MALGAYVPRVVLRRLVSAPEELVQTVEGTVVFTDVSGFTRLSERLARRGTEGAENLVDTINSCFSTLLTDAYGNGGSLLKFGGDALLLWFEGDGHASRGCGSAHAMRHTLRRIGRIRTGASDVILRMSVGVHSGRYELFLVGGSHREFLIAGPSATTVVAMEALASTGQILLSGQTAELLPRRCLGAARGPGVLLARAPKLASWRPDGDTRKPPIEVVERCISTVLRAHVRSAAVAPEHRMTTVSFLQFGLLDELIDKEGVDAAAQALDELVRVAQEGCDRYQVCFLGSDIAAGGGKLHFCSGAPLSVGDDEERMLLALRHVLEAPLRLPIRVGISRGNVFTGDVGPPYRRTYVAMGDVVNLAARLMAKAPYGGMYATPAVVEHSQTNFRISALEPFMVKGKSRPVRAIEVSSALRAAAPRSLRPRLPLVGRHSERALLRSAVAAAKRGSGTLIELVGETGSGKSRLLSEGRELAKGMRFVHCTCEVYARETPYAAWRGPLRQLLGLGWEDPDDVVLAMVASELERNDPELLPWLPLLAIALNVESPVTREVTELASAVRSAKLHEVVLRSLSRALVLPTLVEIEHAHLMDAASAALFEALAQELDSSSWLVVATRRDVPGGLALGDAPHHRLELEPLSLAELELLAQAAEDSAELPPHVVQLAIQRAGGSPEFLLDLLAAAAAGSPDALPDTVGAAATARIDALEPPDRLVVRRASVLGITFHAQRLSDVLPADVPPLEDDFWERLSGVFALEADGRVRFKRPALQEAAYSSLPFKLRRALHGALAARLEGTQDEDPDADPAVLSRHFMLAGDHARAYEYAILAAKRATERFSHADAARLYRRAIEAARGGATGAQRAGAEVLGFAWEQLGDSLRCAGEPDAAAQALAQARRLLSQEPIAQARLCHRHAQVAQRSESPTAAVRWLNRGLRAIEGLDSPDAAIWRARLHAYLAGMRTLQGRWMDAANLCRQAIEESEQVGEAEALARACYTLDWALVELGRPQDATHSMRALEIYEVLRDPEDEATVLNNLGMFAYFEGRWEDAVELYRQAGACSERAGKPSDVAYTDCNVGEVLSDQGRLAEAGVHLERARRVWKATQEGQGVAFVDMLLGRLAVRDGRGEEALALLEAALADMRRFKTDADAGLARALLAEAEAFAGDPHRALAIAREQLGRDDRERPLLGRASGVALARLGQPRAAAEALAGALAVSRERQAEYDIAATIEILDALALASDEEIRERDLIVRRLHIRRLARPDLTTATSATGGGHKVAAASR